MCPDIPSEPATGQRIIVTISSRHLAGKSLNTGLPAGADISVQTLQLVSKFNNLILKKITIPSCG